MSSQQQQQPDPQQGGGEDFQPTSIRRQSNKRRSIPRLHHESVRMKELKNLQAELSNLIPDKNAATSPTNKVDDALQYTSHNTKSSRRASTSSTLSASSTTQTSSTISNNPYNNPYERGQQQQQPLPKFLDRYTTSYTTLPKDIDVVELGLSIDQYIIMI